MPILVDCLSQMAQYIVGGLDGLSVTSVVKDNLPELDYVMTISTPIRPETDRSLSSLKQGSGHSVNVFMETAK